MKCRKCQMALLHLGFDYYGHPALVRWTMPMDGYKTSHWQQEEVCSEAGIIVKSR